MNDNKTILDSLIGTEQEVTLDLDSNSSNNNLTSSRVVGVRYKFYSAVLIVFFIIIGYNYVLPSYESYQLKKVELTNSELQLNNFEIKRLKYESNIGLVDAINSTENQVVGCLNTLQGCKELSDLIKNNFSVVRSYLLLSEIPNDKMSLDEKKILANIDSFLLRRDSLEEGSTIINGILNKIAIGEKQEFNENLYFVPIELQITFNNKDGLMSFIDNVEKKIPIDPDLRILYKIDKITYDIVNHDQEQDSTIFMYLYFYDNKNKG